MLARPSPSLNKCTRLGNSAAPASSVRKVGIKELWTLKWHKNFDTKGKYTKAGGATASTWPDWMKRFKDY